MSARICITGGTGFVGSHLVDFILHNTNWEIKILDRLDCTSTIDRLSMIDGWTHLKRKVDFIWWDLKSELNEYTKVRLRELDYIVGLAASTHVDRSIEDPLSFVMDNVVGTCNLLNFARSLKQLKKIVLMSTDEVMGSAEQEIFYKETDHIRPENPYAASKAGAEALAMGFACTYKLPITITRGMNIFGPLQHKEKFIPSTIRKVMKEEEVIIHADHTKTISGCRFYISAQNVAKALVYILRNGESIKKDNRDTGIYNVVGEKEVSNLDLAKMIADNLKMKLSFRMTDFHSSRPGHDLRYALDGTKLRNLGWEVSPNFEESLKETVDWYLDHQDWLS
jgi:dTDP-glucose 4,6-dehydratase